MKDQYRIEFQVVAFSHSAHISPQRIEERMLQVLDQVILDDLISGEPRGEVFGFIKDLKVTRASE